MERETALIFPIVHLRGIDGEARLTLVFIGPMPEHGGILFFRSLPAPGNFTRITGCSPLALLYRFNVSSRRRSTSTKTGPRQERGSMRKFGILSSVVALPLILTTALVAARFVPNVRDVP